MHFVRGFSLPCLIQETNVELQGSKRLGGLPTASQGVQRRRELASGRRGPQKKYYSRQKWTFLLRTRKRAGREGEELLGRVHAAPEGKPAERGLAVDGENPL